MADPHLDADTELAHILNQELTREERIARLETLLRKATQALAEQQRAAEEWAAETVSPATPLPKKTTGDAAASNGEPRPDAPGQVSISLAALQERIRQETHAFEFDALIDGVGRTEEHAPTPDAAPVPTAEKREPEADGGAKEKTPGSLLLNARPPMPAEYAVVNDEGRFPPPEAEEATAAESNPERLLLAHAALRENFDNAQRGRRIGMGIVAGLAGIVFFGALLLLLPFLRGDSERPNRSAPSSAESTPPTVNAAPVTPPVPAPATPNESPLSSGGAVSNGNGATKEPDVNIAPKPPVSSVKSDAPKPIARRAAVHPPARPAATYRPTKKHASTRRLRSAAPSSRRSRRSGRKHAPASQDNSGFDTNVNKIIDRL